MSGLTDAEVCDVRPEAVAASDAPPSSSCRCELAYSSKVKDAYSRALTDVMHTIPPDLLGSLLHEELTEQRERALTSEGATGGALAFVPFSHSGGGSQRGCLLYPGNQGLDSLSILNKTWSPQSFSSSFLYVFVP